MKLLEISNYMAEQGISVIAIKGDGGSVVVTGDHELADAIQQVVDGHAVVAPSRPNLIYPTDE